MNKKIDKKDPKNQKYFLETWPSDPSFKDWLLAMKSQLEQDALFDITL